MFGIHRRFGTPHPHSTPAVFLDRDGVIVEETNYLHNPADVRMLPDAAQALALLNEANRPAIAVTNQAGIARQMYDWPEFERTQAFIEEQLRPAYLDAVWACGFHPDGQGPMAIEHPFRKPNPGMLFNAAAELNLDLDKSWLVGDKTIDIECAIRAGLRGAILVRTGYGLEMEPEVRALNGKSTSIHFADSLLHAVELILSQDA